MTHYLRWWVMEISKLIIPFGKTDIAPRILPTIIKFHKVTNHSIPQKKVLKLNISRTNSNNLCPTIIPVMCMHCGERKVFYFCCPPLSPTCLDCWKNTGILSSHGLEVVCGSSMLCIAAACAYAQLYTHAYFAFLFAAVVEFHQIGLRPRYDNIT